LKAHSHWSARLEVLGLCLVSSLAAGCTVDSSGLRTSASTAAGGIGSPGSPDAARAAAGGGGTNSQAEGGRGGTAGRAGGGGGSSVDAPALSPDLATANEVAFPADVRRMPEADAPAIPDAPAAGGVLADGGRSATGGTPQTSSATATGGTDGSGGTTNSGATIASGGTIGAGGTTATGGIAGSGGTTNSGATIVSGGISGAGGTIVTGGIAGSGGTTNLGGTIASGGVTRSGGTKDSGGTMASGGVTSSGGTMASGGVTGSGGSIGAVTTACPGAAPAGIVSSFCSCAQYGEWASGSYTYNNDIWGTGPGPQCIWIATATNWGVAANHPATTNIKSYPNISLSPQETINAIASYTSSFDVTVPSSGSWATAYNIWVKGNTPARTQISLWVNLNGAMQPTSAVGGGPAPVADRTNVLVGGHAWDVYFGNNGNTTLVRTSDTNSGSVDILAILRWIIANNNTGRGVFTANWTLDEVQFGFDITSNAGTQAFVTNSFSVTSS